MINILHFNFFVETNVKSKTIRFTIIIFYFISILPIMKLKKKKRCTPNQLPYVCLSRWKLEIMFVNSTIEKNRD